MAALAAAAMFSTVSTGQAEVQVQEEQFRDWVHRCELETEINAVKCFIYTGLAETLPDGTQHSVNIIVGLVGPELDPLVYVEVPDIASPERGVQIQVDTNEPLTGRFAACNIGWCQTVAGGEIAAMMVSQFRAGAQATVRFFLEDNETLLQVPISLFGFTAAYTKLSEDMTAAIAEIQAAAEAAAAAEAEGDEGADGDAVEGDGDAADGAPEDGADEDTAEEGAADDAPAEGADDASSGDAPADDASSSDAPADEEAAPSE